MNENVNEEILTVISNIRERADSIVAGVSGQRLWLQAQADRLQKAVDDEQAIELASRKHLSPGE
jgi:hypothetical protein